MKKITYTQMRSELSDVLERVRLGESFVVTQRGRPDIFIEGHTMTSKDLAQAEENLSKVHEIIPESSQAYEVAKSISRSELFQRALKRTQVKYADIIKALEDK